MEGSIRFFVFKGLDIVQILSERGMKFADIGVCNKAFYFDRNFLLVTLSGDRTFCSQINF